MTVCHADPHYATQSALNAQKDAEKNLNELLLLFSATVCAFRALCVPPFRVQIANPERVRATMTITEDPSLTLGMTWALRSGTEDS